MPACWRNGVKSEPDPSAPIRRSSRSRILFLSASVAAREIACARARFHTLTFVSGSVMSRATSLMKCSSVCDPSIERKPRPFPSVLRYTTACACRSAPCVSTHSVDPSSAGSSPSQSGIDQRPLRRPALLAQLAERARLFEQHGRAADRIARAVDPRVVMVAADDPLVRKRAARHLRDDVVERLRVPVERDLQVHARRPRADPVGDRQRAAPAVGRHRTLDRGQQRLRVRVRDRQDGNLRERRRVLHGQPCRAGRRADVRGQRIARIERHVHHAAALRAVLRPHRAVRKRRLAEVTVVSRIRIDEAADGAVLARDLGLDAAPRRAVPRDDDRAAHGDTELFQDVVVLRPAVVDVHERRRDVAVDRVRVVAGQLLGLLARGRIFRHRRLLELGCESRGRDELEQALARGRKQHVERLDLRVPPERLELREQPLAHCPCRRPIRRDAASRSSASSWLRCCPASASRETSRPTPVPRPARAATRTRPHQGRRRRQGLDARDPPRSISP